jgi:hypothetical protein
MEKITFTRRELCDLVWKESMLTLSKKYAISDVGLRKICIRMGIPLPKAGHWQKLKHKKPVERFRLSGKYSGEETIVLELRSENEESKNLPSFKEMREKIKSDPKINLFVPERLTNPDKLIMAAKEALATNGPRRYGNMQGVSRSGGKTLDIRVSPQFIPRALRFMDFLIKTLRIRGYDVKIEPSSYKLCTNAVVQEQKIGIFLRERLKKVVVQETYGSSQQLHPSGLLFFRMEGEGSREWKDGNRTLEEQFADILATLELEAEKMKIAGEESEKQRVIWEAEEKIKKELEEKRKNDLSDFVELLGKASRWQQAKNLREYIANAEAQAIKNNTLTEELKTRIARAREKADWYDPLILRADELLKYVDPVTLKPISLYYWNSED